MQNYGYKNGIVIFMCVYVSLLQVSVYVWVWVCVCAGGGQLGRILTG